MAKNAVDNSRDLPALHNGTYAGDSSPEAALQHSQQNFLMSTPLG